MDQQKQQIQNETLYLNNLNEKITTLELKTNLFFLFIPFGEIQAILLKKNKKLRGQAFIVFKNEIISSMAMKTLQGFNFMGKPLKIEYAKQRSIILKRINGEVIPAKKQPFKFNPNLMQNNEEDLNQQQSHEKGINQNDNQIDSSQNINDNVQKKIKQNEKCEDSDTINEEVNQLKESNVLLIKDLPDFITQEMLIVLFSQYPGFKDQRLISEKRLAMIEFEKISDASLAYHGLYNFKLDENNIINISYAKF